ncbi:MAG: alpha/beta fold hydrolase [Gammaproteobacteria bacterium]|nr:alpha/beta fold hydrolase [Gammaproteobacteria bacterium]
MSIFKVPIILLFLLLQIVVSTSTYAGGALRADDLTPPGQLVDVGGHRMHIYCQGEGEPTIVLDSGAGGFSLEWNTIQKSISSETRVCAYDRAGYGWSDMGPLPRTSLRIVKELRNLLRNAEIPGPYIMVGHSFGGYTAQFFARNHPQQLAGIVLIDSSHPEQVLRLPKTTKKVSARPENSRTYSITRPVLHDHYPKETGARAYRLMSSWKYRFTRQEEMLNLPRSAEELMQAVPYKTVPLVVLTRGKRVWPHTSYGNEMEKVWRELQDELSALSQNSVHLIAENSGHSIHLDQPELVISALRNLLRQ